MARKPKIPEHANHERWLVSYADFITLLFAFFTVLYATAQTDAGKIKKFVGAAERAFSAGIFSAGSNDLMFVNEGNTSGREIIDLGMNLKDVEKRISQELKKGGTGAEDIKLERHADGLTLQLQTRSFFKPGSDILRPEALAILPGVIGILKASHRKLRIEGHTDDMPIHNDQFESNWELSTGRALAVLRFLLKSEIPPERMSVSGLAEFQPLEPNTTQHGRSRNRRVEIVILKDTPSFWAGLKKPSENEFVPHSWHALITNDRMAPPPPTPAAASTLNPKEEPMTLSPTMVEEKWRPIGDPPPLLREAPRTLTETPNETARPRAGIRSYARHRALAAPLERTEERRSGMCPLSDIGPGGGPSLDRPPRRTSQCPRRNGPDRPAAQ